MHLSHINVTMPKGGEDAARSFYTGHLDLREIPKPEPLRARGGVWFDAGGLDVHLSVEEPRVGTDAQRHFGLECADVDGLRTNLKAAGKPELDRLRDPVESLQWITTQKLLTLGVSVILENGFWSKEERMTFRSKAKELGARVELHFLDVSKDELWRRIEERNSGSSEDSFRITKQDLESWLASFAPPDSEELMAYDAFEVHR